MARQFEDEEPRAWLWPDHEVGKRISRRMREEHNRLYNAYDRLTADRDALLEALKGMREHFYVGPEYNPEAAQASAAADAAIEQAEENRT